MQQLRAYFTAENNPNNHTDTEIYDALVGRTGARRWTFRYLLLDGDLALRERELDNVISCTVTQDWLADIKRTATFAIRDGGGIDYLKDRIQPVARLHIPPYGEFDWTEWPLGVFVLSSPVRQADSTDLVTREVQGYDLLQLFMDDVVTERYTVAAGTLYTDAILDLLAWQYLNVQSSTKTLPVAREWPPGTKKLSIINDLLDAINFNSLFYDERGYAIAQAYTPPSERAEEYVYANDDTSLIIPNVDQTLDLFSVANKWTLVVSDPDRPPLSSTYTNISPASPTSTVRRGRTIVDFRTEEDAVDQATLDAKVARLAFEASQVFESIEFETGINPLHSANDVYRINYEPLAINAKYSEQSWSMQLKAGALMRHRARRVVSL